MSSTADKPARKPRQRLTADQQLARLADSKREEVAKLEARAKRLEDEHTEACNKLGAARAQLSRYEAALPKNEG